VEELCIAVPPRVLCLDDVFPNVIVGPVRNWGKNPDTVEAGIGVLG
jgi:hypothetical protein